MKYIKALFNWRMLIVFLMGFSSGLPFLLVGGTLKAWATKEGLSLTTVGLFSFVGLPYSLKFLWSPLLDRYTPRFLGRRRGWMIMTQFGLALGLIALSQVSPGLMPGTVAEIALVIAFLSATQDIAIDAYRREFLNDLELGLGISLAVMGYRMAILFSGSLALILADRLPWSTVYLIMAAGTCVGILTTLLAPEPTVVEKAPTTLLKAYGEPFKEFFSRSGALWILFFILLYKVGDSMADSMTTPFYIKMGYTLTEIGAVVKLIGIWSIISGGLVGGMLILKIKLQRALWVFGILQAATILGFAWLSTVPPTLAMLAPVIFFENFTAGMGTAGYAGFMAAMTNKRFTATQYALFSSLMGVPRIFLGGASGWLAEQYGWTMFFVICAASSIPGLLLLFKMKPMLDAVDRAAGEASNANR